MLNLDLELRCATRPNDFALQSSFHGLHSVFDPLRCRTGYVAQRSTRKVGCNIFFLLTRMFHCSTIGHNEATTDHKTHHSGEVNMPTSGPGGGRFEAAGSAICEG